jgi:pyruvate dehydrogenase E2 component (dihydrolipoamide acetyltransferase)
MAVAVEMPKLGNTVEECLIARWLKQQGQAVSAGETVVEIETDKTSFEVTATFDGTVLATFFEQGALVPVFTPLFVIGNPGESVEALRPQSKGSTPAADAAGSPMLGARQPSPGGQPVPAINDSLPHFSAPLSPRARGLPKNTTFTRRQSADPGQAAAFWKPTCAPCITALRKSLVRQAVECKTGRKPRWRVRESVE